MKRRKFRSPDELWKYAMEVVALLRASGDLTEAADLLDKGARHPTSSGWEWLGELGQAAATVSKGYRTPPEARRAIGLIRRTARSRTPYEE